MNSFVYTMTTGRQGWDLISMLRNLVSSTQNALNLVAVLIGFAAVLWGIWGVFKNLKNSQQAQWGPTIGAIIIGAFLVVSQFNGVLGISQGASSTVENMAGVSTEAPQIDTGVK